MNHGGYFKMLESGWKRRKETNILFIWYEEMKEDQKEAIRKISKHLQLDIAVEDINRFDDSKLF